MEKFERLYHEQIEIVRTLKADAVVLRTSTRDKFAVAALNGLCANPGGPIQANGMSGWGFCNCDAGNVAAVAYGLADAMIAEREAEKRREL